MSNQVGGVLGFSKGPASYQLTNLLEKMTSNDKDFRFMATNDLMVELEKDSFKFDQDTETKVVKMILKLLNDKNGEVQHIAIKCLGPLVKRVKEYQVETIVDSLCLNMVSEHEQARDISSTGLRTVIAELPTETGALAGNICRRVTGRLVTAIEGHEETGVRLAAMDVLTDLLARFGGLVPAHHEALLAALLPRLSGPGRAASKRAVGALTHLAACCSPAVHAAMIGALATKPDDASLRCLASVWGRAGRRLGRHVGAAFAVAASRLADPAIPGDDEAREHCLALLEAVSRRCPEEAAPYAPQILALCLAHLGHEPGEEGSEEEDEEGDDPSDEEEEDEGWKVRRAAARCCEALADTRPEMLGELYARMSPALVDRFRERREGVRTEVFAAHLTLVRQTRPPDPGADLEPEGEPAALLRERVPAIVGAVVPLMQSRSTRTLEDCFAQLDGLARALPGALAEHVDLLIPGIQFSLEQKNAQVGKVKVEALHFTNHLLTSHPPELFEPYLWALVPTIVSAVEDSFYKIVSEAVLVLEQLVKVIRPLEDTLPSDDVEFSYYVSKIIRCILPLLKVTNIDQQVRERAISCMGQTICNLGDQFTPEDLDTCIPIFLDRIQNEITRLASVNALTKIAASPLAINIRPILQDSFPILASFLRKTQRDLKIGTLKLIEISIRNYSDAITNPMISIVVKELPSLLKDSDLVVAKLTVELVTTIADDRSVVLPDLCESFLPELLVLLKSPLLQGAALDAILGFFQVLVGKNIHRLEFRDLLGMLTSLVDQENPAGGSNVTLNKQSLNSLSKCVAALTTARPEEAPAVVEGFLRDVEDPPTESRHVFALLAIGETGRGADVGGAERLQTAALECLRSPAASEEVRWACAYALGSLAAGDPDQYLPFLLREMEEPDRRQYLLLLALREAVESMGATPEGALALEPYADLVWDLLQRRCEYEEEGTRNVIAECLGKLTLIDPERLLPRLEAYMTSESATIRTTAVTAIKFTLSDGRRPVDPRFVDVFAGALRDPEPRVRRAALATLNTAAHNEPRLVRDRLDVVLPPVYAETEADRSLTHVVEMGPFKHTVDDHLDVRKAAFECMYTLASGPCLDRLDAAEFLARVESGLSDHHDIRTVAYLMVTRLAASRPHAVLNRLDTLVERLRYTVMFKMQANLVRQDYEKQDELRRAALRVVATLLTVGDADKNAQMCEFVAAIRASPELAPFFEAAQRDLQLKPNYSSDQY